MLLKKDEEVGNVFCVSSLIMTKIGNSLMNLLESGNVRRTEEFAVDIIVLGLVKRKQQSR